MTKIEKKEYNQAYSKSHRGEILVAQKRRYHAKYKNSDFIKQARLRIKARWYEWLNRCKMAPCSDCGVQYNPWVMDFDHRDPSQKKFAISSKYGCLPETLEAEIAKCDLVCANCHRERTYRRAH